MEAHVKNVLDRLSHVEQVEDETQWQARCPCHDDRKASLSIGIGEQGQALIHCHAFCDEDDVLKSIGLKMRDLFPPKKVRGRSGDGAAAKQKPKKVNGHSGDDQAVTQKGELGPMVAAYDYRDEQGNLLFQVTRHDPKDFRQRRPDGAGGWLSKLTGVRRVLYRLPELLASDKAVAITEGEKDVLRLAKEGFTATTNPGGAGKWQDSYSEFLIGRHVVLFPDNDEPGREHVQQVAHSLNGKARSIKIVELPGLPPKGDVSDWFNAGGTRETLIEIVNAAPFWTSPKDGEKRQTRTGTKILIDVDEYRTNDAAVDALANEASIFQRGGTLVHVVRNATLAEGVCDVAPPRIAQVPLALLRDRLTAIAQFVKLSETKDGFEEIPAHPPDWCVKAVAARGNWPKIRPLRGFVTAPVLKPDGTVLDKPGYDVASGLLYESDGQSYSIPESPSLDDAKKAVDSIKQLVSDFPFAKPEHRSAYLAALLTPLARFAFDGPAPLFLFDANVRGSGKSLASDLISLIVTGRPMPRTPNTDDDSEMRKRITSIALCGEQIVLLDNIGTTLGCPSLDAALTATTWKERLLGTNQEPVLPLSAVWYATGNNVMLAADTARRVLPIRLDSPHEQPELRDGFAFPNIKTHVRQNRVKYLSDALTILRAYFVAACPKQKLSTWGSFEGWSDLIRQAVVWCGELDPGSTREEFVESADIEGNALRELIHGWGEMDADCVGVTTSTILEHLAKHPDRCVAVREAILELCPAPPGRLPSSKSLGRKLRGLSGRVVDGRFLDSRKDRNGSLVWRVRQAEVKTTCDSRTLTTPADDVLGLRGQQNPNPAPNPAGQPIEY